MSDMNTDFLNHVPKLSRGAHEEGSGELCVMEAIAFVMGEPHSDMPECTAPTIAYYCQELNDHMPDDWRQRLWDYAWRIAGTNDLAYERQRGEYLAMQAVNVFAPLACEGAVAPDLVSAMRNAQTPAEANAAARAAARAAHADRAAARAAARAARAADDAARAAGCIAACAARAARAAACIAARAAAWQAALNALDGVLKIGPEPSPVAHPERVLLLEAYPRVGKSAASATPLPFRNMLIDLANTHPGGSGG